MRVQLYRLAYWINPRLDDFADSERYAAAGYVVRGMLFVLPAIIGVVWLATLTDPMVLVNNWLFLTILFGFMLILSQLWLEMHYLTEGGVYRSDRRSFWGEALWSGVLVIGPSAIWLGLILPWASALLEWRSAGRVRHIRLISQAIFRTSVVIPSLVEVALYQWLGGRFPLPDLSPPSVIPAALATLGGFSIGSLMIGVSTAVSRIMTPPAHAARLGPLSQPRPFLLITLIGPLAGLVAIMPAGLHSLAGEGAFFSFQAILLVGVLIVDRLSRAGLHERQRTRELTQLEHLGQTFLESPLDASGLPDVLHAHVPGLFPSSLIAIRLYPDRTIYTHPDWWHGPGAGVWRWQAASARPFLFRPRQPRAWRKKPDPAGVILAPILQAEGGQPVGRIYLEHHDGGGAVDRLLPAVQSLAGQVASALNRARVYQQTLAERLSREMISQELTFAGQIQSSFLPDRIPQIEGCQIATLLQPARETSGDFYDIIPMWDGRLGVVIADVADKGMGAALFMALCRTLLRVYAVEYSTRYPDDYATHPERVVSTINKWILDETSTDLFVTLFYGIYDPRTSRLTYCNAGHNPPLLVCEDRSFQRLTLTGLPIGLFEERSWECDSTTIAPGNVLVLYTDGVTEARNRKRTEFGEERLQRTILANLSLPVEKLCRALLSAVNRFSGATSHQDDITLIVLRRDSPPPQAELIPARPAPVSG